MLCPSSVGITCSICPGARAAQRGAELPPSHQPPRARNGFCLHALAPGVLTGGCDWDVWALLASTHYTPGAPPCKFQQPKMSPDIVQCPGEVPPENQGFLVADGTFFTRGWGSSSCPLGACPHGSTEETLSARGPPGLRLLFLLLAPSPLPREHTRLRGFQPPCPGPCLPVSCSRSSWPCWAQGKYLQLRAHPGPHSYKGLERPRPPSGPGLVLKQAPGPGRRRSGFCCLHCPLDSASFSVILVYK